MITKQELIYEIQKNAGRANKNIPKSLEHKRKLSEVMLKLSKKYGGSLSPKNLESLRKRKHNKKKKEALTPEHRKKISESIKARNQMIALRGGKSGLQDTR